MIEKLTIKNFGPIRSAEIEIRRFTVLIGEQATGKSTVAKLLAICRYFSYVRHYSVAPGFLDGLKAWQIFDLMNEHSRIEYECTDYRFMAFSEGPVFQSALIGSSEKFRKLEDEAGIYGRNIPPSFYLNDVNQIMDNPFYLPAERGLQSIFSLGKNSIQNISDSLFNQLAKMDQVAREFTNEVFIEPLKIYYKNIQGRGYFRKEGEDNYHSMFNAATGYQSSIPVVLACKYYHQVRKKAKTFIVEEPELNLFPIAQKELIYYLVSEINNTEIEGKRSSLFMATHSPYILTSLNNLIEAWNVGSADDNKHKVAEVTPEKFWLNPDDISVYIMKSDGTCESIMDKEEHIIDVTRIDEVSRELNEEFDKILNIAYNKA